MNLPKDFPFKPSSVYTYGVRNGIIWAVVQAPTGYAYNGYVRVPDGHPWDAIGACQVFVDEGPFGELTFSEDNWIGFDTLHSGQVWPEDPNAYLFEGAVVMSVPLVVDRTLRLADAAHKLVPDYAVPVYCYVPTPKEKVRPPTKPQFAGSGLGQRDGGVDGYHEWQGFGVGWSDFKPHHPEEFYTEDEVGMPSIKNPMGSR